MRFPARVWVAMPLAAIVAAGSWFAVQAQNESAAPQQQAQQAPPQAPPAVALAGGLTTPPADVPKRPYRRVVGPETLNPGDWPQHWPYPDEYDSAVGAAEVHHIRYIDPHVRLVEVAYFAGVHGQMHGHPWPSVFAVDAPTPKGYNVNLDPERPPFTGRGPAPEGMQFPTCANMSPQSPHAETNKDTWPHHFYRLEFMRNDGAGIQDHWQAWYPHMLDPLLPVKNVKAAKDASKFSADWPYSIAYDTYHAAPNNYKLLYEDDHIRFLEVTVRPGETSNMAGDPYPGVLAIDAISNTATQEIFLDPKSALNGQGASNIKAPKGFDSPVCSAVKARAPYEIHNTGKTPVHYYRIEFKRIDGDGLKDHWREWYPWMAKLADDYAAHPYVSNYY